MEAAQLGTKPDARRMAGVSGGTDSLVSRASRMLYGAAIPDIPAEPQVPETENDGEERVMRCADGYLRVTPVQPYRTSEDYYRKLRNRWISAGIIAVLLVVVLWAVLRSGIFGHG